MRLLHTSDWHLGRSFHREDLLGHQSVFIDHLVEVVVAEQIDAVLVAGDIYDRALPPVDAVRLADEAFTRLAALGVTVIITSGNHDSTHRLGFGSRLLESAGLHIRTDLNSVGRPVLLGDDAGEVAIYPLPYLDPRATQLHWELEQRTHQASIDHALQLVRADLDRRSQQTRSVVMAHTFVSGGEPSESERDISVGGVQRVAASSFDGIDYVALGHLHGQQSLTDAVRYCGSPIAYSFSEAKQSKGSWIVDLTSSSATYEFIAAPVPRALATVEGTLEELLTDSAHTVAEDAWVQAVITDDVRPRHAMERLQRRFPHALQLRFATPTRSANSMRQEPRARLGEFDVALDFTRTVRGSGVTDGERALLESATAACCLPDEASSHRESGGT